MGTFHLQLKNIILMENISTDRELATPNYIGMLSHLNIHSIDGAIIFKLQEKQNKKITLVYLQV